MTPQPLLSPDPTIALTMTAGRLQADMQRSASYANGLEKRSNGLYVAKRKMAQFQMYQAAASQALPAAFNTVTFDAVNWDTDGMYASPTTAIIRRDGVYSVIGTVGVDKPISTLGEFIRLIIAGAEPPGARNYSAVNYSDDMGGFTTIVDVEHIAPLALGTTISLQFFWPATSFPVTPNSLLGDQFTALTVSQLR